MKNQEGSGLIVRGQVVYIVEDEPAMREAVTTLLRSVDFDVCAFATAREFFEYSRPDVPSCLILDVRLQGQSGLSVQDQIVESGIDIPIIFMTAHGDIAMTVKAMKSGAADFLASRFVIKTSWMPLKGHYGPMRAVAPRNMYSLGCGNATNRLPPGSGRSLH